MCYTQCQRDHNDKPAQSHPESIANNFTPASTNANSHSVGKRGAWNRKHDEAGKYKRKIERVIHVIGDTEPRMRSRIIAIPQGNISSSQKSERCRCCHAQRISVTPAAWPGSNASWCCQPWGPLRAGASAWQARDHRPGFADGLNISCMPCSFSCHVHIRRAARERWQVGGWARMRSAPLPHPPAPHQALNMRTPAKTFALAA